MDFNLYNDIATRTGGDIYVGVVGPVRSGKSTFIKKFMDEVVIDSIIDINERARVVDELPQSGDGKSIMTTQPHFVPNNAVGVCFDNMVRANIRMIDCVGYLIDGVIGAEENGKERLVRTPWTEDEIPFKDAATLGTDKVIREHSTIGVLVTTDGSISDISRENYVDAEEKVVEEMKRINKPFVVVLNTKNPNDESVEKLSDELSNKYGVPVVAKDVLNMTKEDIFEIMNDVLLEFPLKLVDINAPRWIQALSKDNSIIKELVGIVKTGVDSANKMKDFNIIKGAFENAEYFEVPSDITVDAGKGRIVVNVKVKEEFFYSIISEECGRDIKDDFMLMSYMRFLKKAETEYSKLKNALDEVYATGYGIVTPNGNDMELEKPETFKQNGQYGIKMCAHAPSLHIVRVDVDAEIKPIIGTEEGCGEYIDTLLSKYDEEKEELLKTNIFGRTAGELLSDGLMSKSNVMPEEAKTKMRKTLTRIVNEGKGGVICILL